MMLGDGKQVLVGEYEFSRWMFLPASNKTWLLVIMLGCIGGAGVYILRKAFKGRK